MKKPNRIRKIRAFSMSDEGYEELQRQAARSVLPSSRYIEQLVFGKRKRKD